MENTPESGFDSIPGFELTDSLRSGFAADRIVTPTEVQRAAIEPILAGRHVVIESGTGTGKTLAYVLPLLQRLRSSSSAKALCFAPATELALQTLRTVERYKEPTLSVGAALASVNPRQQQTRVQQSTRFIVGTPPQILELYERRKMKGVSMLVLDEPEPILGTRDAAFLREVLSRPEPKMQLVFVAATFGANAERWISELMGPEVVRTRVTDDPLRQRISHSFVRVKNESLKDRELIRFIEEKHCARAIVFVNQENLLRHLYRFLNGRGLATVSVSRERSKQECKQALLAFGRSEARVLLTTDGAATGLDIPDVPWVLNYELPASALAYVHRAGRTGRAGKRGQSVLFVGDDARPRLERLGKELGIEFSLVSK